MRTHQGDKSPYYKPQARALARITLWNATWYETFTAEHMGQAGGTAAALCAKKGVSPKDLDVKELQSALLDVGFYLGDRVRLKELGLQVTNRTRDGVQETGHYEE